MKTLRAFSIAAGASALVAGAIAAIPGLSRPAFASYFVAALLVTAAFDYTRGRSIHRRF